METDQLTRINASLDTIEKDNYRFSEAVVDKLADLSDEEKTVLAQDAMTSTRTLAEEVLEHSNDGKLSINEMGEYTLNVSDSSISLFRDREFENQGMYNEFTSVFFLDTDRQGSHTAYEALDALETMQAVHSAILPQEG